MNEISKYVHGTMYWCEDAQIKDFGMFGKKSEAEILLLIKTLTLLKQNPDLQKIMSSVKRIFKYSYDKLYYKMNLVLAYMIIQTFTVDMFLKKEYQLGSMISQLHHIY